MNLIARPLRLLFILATTTLALAPIGVAAQGFDTKARFAVLMDAQSGMLLFHKSPDERMEPASMAKLMTLAVVFNRLRAGAFALTDEFSISEHAWRTGGAASGGSTMFADLNSRIPVETLIRSVIVQSGNDAAIALAEGVAGSEETFAQMENQLAGEIGLTNSNFANATGLPDPDQYVTARDLGTLARYLVDNFPEYYHYFSEAEMEWNGIKQANRNSLVETGLGVDGLKTGHTEASGYGTVVSTPEGGRRLIAVLHGLTSMRERAEEARKLITWGIRSFDRIAAFPEGKMVGYADVYGGAEGAVGLVGKGAIDLFVPKGSKDCPQASIVYNGPLRPPVQQGAQVAELRVMCDGTLVQVAPLFAAQTVEDGDLVRKATDALKHLIIGWI